jgi:hypothetical protein
MLPRDNVLDMKAQFGKLLRGTTVFALVSSPRTDRLAQLRIHLALLALPWDGRITPGARNE